MSVCIKDQIQNMNLVIGCTVGCEYCYHVTFEPLFDDPGEVELHGIDWVVVGTMTGVQSRKVHTEPERLSQNLCKPPMWCRIGASHWRFLQ